MSPIPSTTLRSPEEILAAHDRLCAIILGDVEIEGCTPESEAHKAIVIACDVLCWALHCEHNRTFERNIEKIDAALRAKGYELVRHPSPITIQRSRRPN